jgi:hypothetical protein
MRYSGVRVYQVTHWDFAVIIFTDDGGCFTKCLGFCHGRENQDEGGWPMCPTYVCGVFHTREKAEKHAQEEASGFGIRWSFSDAPCPMSLCELVEAKVTPRKAHFISRHEKRWQKRTGAKERNHAANN